MTGPANDPNADLAKPLQFVSSMQNWSVYFLKAQFEETRFTSRLAVAGAHLILGLEIASPSVVGQPTMRGTASPQQCMHLLTDLGMSCCPSMADSKCLVPQL